jgi:hypothetical protein
MKTTALLLALIGLAPANLAPRADTKSTISIPPTTTSLSFNPTATCRPGDVTCEAACVGAAQPNSSQVSETNNCVAKCPQGNGTQSSSDVYD